MIAERWGAHTKTKKVRSVVGSINYLIKYLAKSFMEERYMLTPAMLWINNMRSYGLSKNLIDLIQGSMHISNGDSQKISTTLQGEESEWGGFKLIGIFSREALHRQAIERGSQVEVRGWAIELDFMPEVKVGYNDMGGLSMDLKDKSVVYDQSIVSGGACGGGEACRDCWAKEACPNFEPEVKEN